VIFIVL